jgi:[ribosomal protein S18]-alanine N-acetyltransferase
MLKTDSITIRTAVPADLAVVAAIEHGASPFPWPDAAVYATLTNDCGLLLVACGENGCVCGHVFGVIAADELEIHTIAVHPDFRRNHIGRMLLNAVIAQAQQRTVARAYLEVRSRNLPAISLYTKTGFSTCRLRRNYYSGDNDDALVMFLDIQNYSGNT